ncbi:MAG: type II secretion system protein J [Planctomycetota bacterium]
MKQTTLHRPARKGHSAAFTLVEMLVSVTLVLLMMTLFASMFQLATGSMTKQRGISQLDQSARVLDTVVRRDFQKRTFRYAHPFYPGEDSATSPTSFANRAGYLYFSTNEPGGIDDLVQFTVDANILNESQDATPYFGRATELLDRVTAGNNGLRASPNQPEADDGTLTPNSISSGSTAEICYFIRNGNLYRRINLIREPLKVAGQNLGPQPTSRGGYDFFCGYANPATPGSYDGLYATTINGLTNDFYRDFDLTAFRSLPDGNGNRSATVLGVGSLGNESSGAASEVFANPGRRFGFDPFTGLSREHTQMPVAGVASRFLGRFLHAETSALNFNWPQQTARDETGVAADSGQVLRVDLNFDGSFDVTTNGNPFDVAGCPLALNPLNGVVSSFDNATGAGVEGRGGIRRAEDLLLANVHEMKVELWDNRLQRFVPPGHTYFNAQTGQAGDYHVLRNLNNGYGPRPGVNVGTVFDTWHSKAATAGTMDATGAAKAAPYIAYRYYPPTVSQSPPGPLPATFPNAVTSYWASGQNYSVSPGNGSVVFGRKSLSYPGFDVDSNGIFHWIQDATGIPPQAYQIAYRAIGGNDIDGDGNYTSGTQLPNFPAAPGRRFTDGEIIWESFDNRVPLKSIRLTFRFLDKQSDNMRNLSLIIPMTETVQ